MGDWNDYYWWDIVVVGRMVIEIRNALYDISRKRLYPQNLSCRVFMMLHRGRPCTSTLDLTP